jgi:hypothetical protein
MPLRRFRQLLLTSLVKFEAEKVTSKKATPTPSKFIADSSPNGIGVVMHAHPCAARKANLSRGGGAKPRDLLARR